MILRIYAHKSKPDVKLHLSKAAGQNLFTGYGPDYLAINAERYGHNLVVTPTQIFEDWRDLEFEQLTEAHFEFLLTLTPEIILLGSGTKLRFPAPVLTRSLIQANIGLEVMDSPAACRTYNILMAEGRSVVAAVLLK
jgi:uncharacterized protein